MQMHWNNTVLTSAVLWPGCKVTSNLKVQATAKRSTETVPLWCWIVWHRSSVTEYGTPAVTCRRRPAATSVAMAWRRRRNGRTADVLMAVWCDWKPYGVDRPVARCRVKPRLGQYACRPDRSAVTNSSRWPAAAAATVSWQLDTLVQPQPDIPRWPTAQSNATDDATVLLPTVRDSLTASSVFCSTHK